MDYYRTVYKRVDSRVLDDNDFLGDTSTHPDIISSKLNEHEKIDLDHELIVR